MVESISPDYYAVGRYKQRYELTGSGFDRLPDDIIGLVSNRNDNPLLHRNDGRDIFILSVIERNDSSIIFEGSQESQYNTNYYFGGILSEDQESVYWVNNTMPLP